MNQTFTGKCKWAKLQTPDEKYNNYTICLYLDKKQQKKLVDTGWMGDFKEDDDGTFATFRRKPHILTKKGDVIKFGPPQVTLGDEPFGGLVGNGSEVKVDVSFRDFVGKDGPGVAAKLEAVTITNLVEYSPDA